jgi:hypothetical protein
MIRKHPVWEVVIAVDCGRNVSELLEQRKAGRALVFVAPKDLESRLQSKGK